MGDLFVFNDIFWTGFTGSIGFLFSQFPDEIEKEQCAYAEFGGITCFEVLIAIAFAKDLMG